jgi:hypothetical protein
MRNLLKNLYTFSIKILWLKALSLTPPDDRLKFKVKKNNPEKGKFNGKLKLFTLSFFDVVNECDVGKISNKD